MAVDPELLPIKGCGCSGIRYCLICKPNERTDVLNSEREVYQCYRCGGILLPGEEYEVIVPPLKKCAAQHNCKLNQDLIVPRQMIAPEKSVPFDGVQVIKDFISTEFETFLVDQMDMSSWAESQSGRRKQDYGPKVNFKRAKVKLGSFNGLPAYSEELVRKLSQIDLLKNFVPVELCNLDYDPIRGSAIDPHLDDSWIWGERLVTVNLLSDTYLSFTHPTSSITVHVPMPRLSLIIVMGVARHVWTHSISRKNIISRRVAMTLRELGEDFLEGNKEEEIGKTLVQTAGQYRGAPVNLS